MYFCIFVYAYILTQYIIKRTEKHNGTSIFFLRSDNMNYAIYCESSIPFFI